MVYFNKITLVLELCGKKMPKKEFFDKGGCMFYAGREKC
jgi:hypothetical protein